MTALRKAKQQLRRATHARSDCGVVHAASAAVERPPFGRRNGRARFVPRSSRQRDTHSAFRSRRRALPRRLQHPAGAGQPARALRLSRHPQTLAGFLLLALAISAFISPAGLEPDSVSDKLVVETAATVISALARVLFLHRSSRHLRPRYLLL